MELDKRIKDISTIQTILRYDVNCIGCKGYFFDEFIQTKDLSKCRYGELVDITTHDDRNDLCFKAEYEEGLVGFYRFFIPEADLKPKEPEKKYRAFTLNEFLERYKIGNTVTFRLKKDEHVPEAECLVEYHRMITGYESLPEDRDKPGKGSILLGGCPPVSLARLFEFYELDNDFNWQPFGILEEE